MYVCQQMQAYACIHVYLYVCMYVRIHVLMLYEGIPCIQELMAPPTNKS